MLNPRLIVLQSTPYCNIDCEYCYLGNRSDRRLMAAEVVDAVCEKLLSRLDADAAPRVVWHAGEPTVAPVSWYQQAHEKLRRVSPPGTTFAIQTNGVAISRDWVEFLRQNDIQVGVSIDGLERFHNMRRKTRAGRATWSLVINNLHRLQEAGLRVSVISVLSP